MCPAACLLRHVSPSSCLLAVSPFAFLSVSPFASSLVSCLCSPYLVVSFRRAYSFGWHVRLATPVRLDLLTLPVSRVAGRGVPRLALISSCVPPLVSACLLAVLCSARPRETVADVIASFLRFVAAVPPLSRIALSSRRSCRGTGRCRVI